MIQDFMKIHSFVQCYINDWVLRIQSCIAGVFLVFLSALTFVITK